MFIPIPLKEKYIMSDWQEISPQKANEKIELEGANVIDIRDPDSYAGSHISGAIQLIDKKEADDFMTTSDKEKPLIVYCYHGISSQAAAAYFAQKGFNEVYSMAGGFESYHLSYPAELFSKTKDRFAAVSFSKLSPYSLW